MSQGDEFELEGEATTNPEREKEAEGGQKRNHAHDGKTAAPKTLCFLGSLNFEHAQPKYLIRDRDASYGHAVTRRLAAMGIRDHPTAPRSPWQNGHAERLIGSIRRECLDHIVVFGEAHLRRILFAYADYYNEVRTHLSLFKDSPVQRPVQRCGQISAQPILGGLHHQYCRM